MILMFCGVTPLHIAGRDSSVDIATRYGLDGPGIECRWWARLSALVQTICGAHPAYYTMFSGSFPAKRPGRGVDRSPPSSAEVKERVQPYRFSLWVFVTSSRVNCELYASSHYIFKDCQLR